MRNVIHTTLQILFPPHCGGCDAKGFWLCPICVSDIHAYAQNCFFCERYAPQTHVCETCQHRFSLQTIHWAWRYSHEKTHKIIGNYKYKGLRGAAPALAQHLEKLLEQLPKDEWYTLPIPIHTSKERERGFNQSYLLARELNLPMINRALVRTKATPPQARSDSRKARFHSIHDAFMVARPADIAGKAIVLVDDVATTGATLSEAARVLKKAGARTIAAVVLAHG